MIDVLLIVACLIGYGGGFLHGKYHESTRQLDKRLQFSISGEFQKLTLEEKVGALAMWNWLKEN